MLFMPSKPLALAVLLIPESVLGALPLPPPPPVRTHTPPPPPPPPPAKRPAPQPMATPSPRQPDTPPIVTSTLILPKASVAEADKFGRRVASKSPATRDHKSAGGALLVGAAASITASIGLQALALRQILNRCQVPEHTSVSACIGDEPTVVAAGAAGAIFGAAGIGLAAGGGWELGAWRRPRRVTQVLGALTLGFGLSALVGSRLVRLNSETCEDVECVTRQGITDLAVRNAGVFLVAGGAAALTAYARAKRVSVTPTRYAGGGGLLLTVRW